MPEALREESRVISLDRFQSASHWAYVMFIRQTAGKAELENMIAADIVESESRASVTQRRYP